MAPKRSSPSSTASSTRSSGKRRKTEDSDAKSKHTDDEEECKTGEVEEDATPAKWHHVTGLAWANLGGKEDDEETPFAAKKIASFDMDGTFIVTKSGKVHPVNAEDWKLFAPKVVTRLKAVRKEGFKVVVFTNQLGVSQGKMTLDEVTGKMEAVQRKIGVPMQVFVMTHDDMFRKPRLGAWNLMLKDCNGGLDCDTAVSFYVGDAAGREKVGKKKKDHSFSDYCFSINAGLQFHTPEAFFLGDKSSKPNKPPFDPRIIGSKKVAEKELPLVEPSEEQEVVVLVGPPGGGKTTSARKWLSAYTHVNQDILKTKEKCAAACKAALDAGKSVVVDNQNRDAATRKPYLAMAKSKSVKARAVYFDVPKELCFHLDAYRMLSPDTAEHRPSKVPPMVIHSFFKYKEPPTKQEGFEEVITITLETLEAGPFERNEARKLFHSFLL